MSFPVVVTSRPVLYCDRLVGKHLLACYIQVPQPHSMTSIRTILTVLERKLVCHKQPKSDLVASQQDEKSHVFIDSVTFITTRQTQHCRTRHNKKMTRWLQQQAGKCMEQVCFISLTHSLSVMGTVAIKYGSAMECNIWIFITDGDNL